MLTAAADGDQFGVERAALELRRRVTVRADGTACLPGRALIQGSRLGDGRVTVESTIRCPAPPMRLGIRDDWFDLFGEHYRTIARIETSGGVREAVFLPDAREATVELDGIAVGQNAADRAFVPLRAAAVS